MGVRGRKSDAELSVVQIGTDSRPPAPVALTEAEGHVWNSITASLSADWFRPSDWPILAAYCQTAAQYDKATLELAAEPLTLTDMNGRLYKHPLLAVQNQAAQRLAMLAVKLRLCPSSRMRQDATPAKGKQQPANKPWQFGKG